MSLVSVILNLLRSDRIMDSDDDIPIASMTAKLPPKPPAAPQPPAAPAAAKKEEKKKSELPSKDNMTKEEWKAYKKKLKAIRDFQKHGKAQEGQDRD
ncbi:hypothetical protein TrRE_jg8906 [Triparma retinervis]|uniref:Uncharacterized protein n=1 Tax=Triparma retinervis TaxID=2557542 RepID=A0A9W7EFL1_9STRA|nr:hypothetical protein TrRE_jg8906 [Triparma retinervis]